MTGLVERFRHQARMCRAYGSPLTGRLLEGAADDLRAGGVVADLMAPHVDDAPGSVPSLRFAGALHRLVLMGEAPALAAHYPSVGGTADVEQSWTVAQQVCMDHLERLRHLVTLPVQTNEVGRAVVLYGGLLQVGGAVRLLELGSSGGLNLRCDAFAYEVGEAVRGDPSSRVRFVQPWEGAVPAYREVEVVERKGCDPRPVDPTTPDGELTLLSYVWGDQLERLGRLRAAIEIAREVPATVERLGALDFLRRELMPTEGLTTVVWHSVMWQYVDADEQRAVDALLEEAGAHATSDAPVVRLSLEPEHVDGGSYEFRVHLQRWPGGARTHIADALGHGPPVRWLANRPESVAV